MMRVQFSSEVSEMLEPKFVVEANEAVLSVKVSPIKQDSGKLLLQLMCICKGPIVKYPIGIFSCSLKGKFC